MSDIARAAQKVASELERPCFSMLAGVDITVMAFQQFAKLLDRAERDRAEQAEEASKPPAAETSAPTHQPTYETLTPTSELLNKAARMINDLMMGRGVDRRNGLQWQAFVRELYDRAAAFKRCEDEGKS